MELNRSSVPRRVHNAGHTLGLHKNRSIQHTRTSTEYSDKRSLQAMTYYSELTREPSRL